ncbi:MAG: hypothetical protein M3Y52_04555 [Actinomycetota bacterium]|nr:hypothetical protein [Actinomycetota bacterium]
MRAVLAGGVGILVASTAIVVAGWSGVSEARGAYDVAVDRFETANESYLASFEEVLAARREARVPLELAREVDALGLGPYADPATASALSEAVQALESSSAAAVAERVQVSVRDNHSVWPPALREASVEVEALARDLDERSRGLEALAQHVRDALERTERAGDALVASVAASAPRLEEAHASARNADRLAFRDATAIMGRYVGAWDADTPVHLAAYVAAVERLIASDAAEEAEKAGDLFVQRQAVEDYARSIAGGVLLEFDWAPIVNGFGEGTSYGGTATASDVGAPHAMIALSDSIARDWPWSDIGRAVVVHEVGHAMTGKCAQIFTPTSGLEHEAWATAWAIGMGMEGNGNGESLYGRPPAELIERSLTCR